MVVLTVVLAVTWATPLWSNSFVIAWQVSCTPYASSQKNTFDIIKRYEIININTLIATMAAATTQVMSVPSGNTICWNVSERTNK